MLHNPRFEDARPWVENCRRPIVLTHRKPDGDALGAVAAMALAVRQLEREPICMLFERPFPPRYPFLEHAVDWRYWSEGGPEIARTCDAAIVVDTCSWSQLEPVAEYLRTAPPTLVIDHHHTRDEIGTRPGDLLICDTSAAATCLLIAEWIRGAGLATTPAIAEALFTGLATDCGWFRFSNTDARALRVAAELCESGATPNALYRPIYERDPAAKLRLIGRMLLSLELHAEGLIAVMKLRHNDFVETGADRAMTEDLVNEAGRLEGIEATLLFTEDEAGIIRVNLRSRSRLDVSQLAAQFKGGGHARAAGARVAGALDTVAARVLQAAKTALGT